MFDWFKKKTSEPTNVVPFPELKELPKMGLPKEEKSPNVFYRIGITDNNRVTFQMGHGEITMNKEGIDNLIRQLSVFRDQLEDEEDFTDE